MKMIVGRIVVGAAVVTVCAVGVLGLIDELVWCGDRVTRSSVWYIRYIHTESYASPLVRTAET